MAKLSLQAKDLRKLGYPGGPVISRTIQVMHKHFKHADQAEAIKILKMLLKEPEKFAEDEVLGKITALLVPVKQEVISEIPLTTHRKSYPVFGEAHIEQTAIHQMEVAMKLPVAVAGALMPDAHQGYGLPIGGVLATHNAVIPFGVGVDIGCRMALSIFDLSPEMMNGQHQRMENILLENTLFGAGREFKKPMDDAVLERKEFREINILKTLHGKAGKQIGSSGSGNHFAEFGTVALLEADNEFGLAPGNYLGLLTHSGSRGLGAGIAEYYTQIALNKCRLPKSARHLAWLDLGTEEGEAYWLCMTLAGDYASACHNQIHQKIAKALGTKPAAKIENHHNFAWKQMHEGSEVIVHRKGATPAALNELGIIPGSMVNPGFIVRGKGNAASLQSASHGAGRRISRSQAKSTITMHELKSMLEKHDVTLFGGGVDEAPQAYKNIEEVMSFQKNLVDVIGKFYPKIVRMED